jgi:SlyX protein
MPAMHKPDDRTDQRLVDLEIKLSFQEDLLERLNDEVVRQAQLIDQLVREVVQLRQQQAQAGEAGGARNLRDELPPHY